MNKRRILKRTKNILKKYNNDKSKYYIELKKSYEEYQQNGKFDKTTEDLYLGYMNNITELYFQQKHSKVIILSMIIVFLIMVLLSTYSTCRYFDIARNQKNNIIKINNNVSINVTYNNLKNFNAMTLSNEKEMMNLEPLNINIYATSNNNNKIKYELYIIEKNNDILKKDLMNRDVFLYNINTKNENSGIKKMKGLKILNDKILIHSDIINPNTEENIDLRIWIDDKTKLDYQNKLYRFTLYVVGYQI